MSKASGLVLLVAGLSAAAYVALPSGIDTGEPELPPHFTDVAKIPPPSGASEVALATPEPQAVGQMTSPLAMARKSRRMILPERVFGRSGTNIRNFGRAIGPMT